MRARYLAERHEIAARHAEREVIGPPEIRSGPGAHYFTPHRPFKDMMNAVMRRYA